MRSKLFAADWLAMKLIAKIETKKLIDKLDKISFIVNHRPLVRRRLEVGFYSTPNEGGRGSASQLTPVQPLKRQFNPTSG